MGLRKVTCVGALLLTVAGCAQETPAGPSPQPCGVSLAASRTDFGLAGGTATLTVSADSSCRWTLTHPSWVTVSPAKSGVGSAELLLTVPTFPGPSRSGTLAAGGAQLDLTQSLELAIVGATCSSTAAGDRGWCTSNLTEKRTSSRMSVDLSGLGLPSDVQVPAVQGCATCFDVDVRVPDGAQPGPVQVRFRFEDGPGRVATATAIFTVLPK